MKEKNILITGGTGSFGRAFVKAVFDRFPEVERLVVFSRDELKQFEMAQSFPASEFPGIRFFLGDVRDKDRLRRAMEGIDVIVHAAALKQVPAAEYNPMEFVKTNVIGAENIVEAALDTGVPKIVALSTDKACAPVNLYGATKLCSDKIFVAANSYGGGRLNCSVVRYGNVMGSRGSVIPFFLAKKSSGMLPITDERMTRFNITLDEGVQMVFDAISEARGGEIFVPKIPSYRINDVAEAIAPECRTEIVGIRPGEKIHEEMITEGDAPMTVDLGERYAILPSGNDDLMQYYLNEANATLVPEDFSYNSGTNDDFLDVGTLRDLIEKQALTAH